MASYSLWESINAMKTTIDQALNKVFQQPARSAPSTIERRPIEWEPQAVAPRPSQTIVRPLELYIDPPHSTLRPPRVASCRDAVALEQERDTQCDADRPSAGDAPATHSVISTAPEVNDVARQWDEAWVYQTLISSPPTEEMVAAPNQDFAESCDEADADAACGSESGSVEVLDEANCDADGECPSSDAECRTREVDFRPAWEVDSLGLPPICRQIVEHVSAGLSDVCQFLQPDHGEPRNLVSIDSLEREEGRTTLALALAHALAQQGQRILLVDADFSHPQLATALGLAVSQGWENAVSGELSVQDCCIYSIGDGFAVLPLGRGGLVVEDLQTLQRIQSLLQDLSTHFDRVILDQGPGGHGWVSLPPQRLLAHVVVRNLRTTSNESLQRFLHRIPQRPEVLISLIDNFATPSAVSVARSA